MINERSGTISAAQEMSQLHVFIIDIDSNATEALSILLKKGGISLIHTFSDLDKIDERLITIHPDLVFIDRAGFQNEEMDVLSQIRMLAPDARFIITQSNEVNNQLTTLFGNNTLLEKPVQFSKLNQVISGFLIDRKLNHLQMLHKQSNGNGYSTKLKFSTRKGHIFVEPEEIIYFKADSNYTHIYLKNDKQITVAKSLGQFEEGLVNSHFARISRSLLINLNYLTALDRKKQVCVLGKNGNEETLHISKKYVKILLEKFRSCCG